MGTKALPMPSVMSLIFPIEEAGISSNRRDSVNGHYHYHSDSIAKQLKKLTRPRTAYEKQLTADVTFFKKQLMSRSARGPSVDIVDLACSLTNLGHEVKVRYAEGGGANCFRNLFHEFLLVKGKADSAGTEIVVETAFSEHFLIPCATPAYSKFYESFPAVFVGTIHQMAPVVELITHEMSKAFAEAGVTMPPWRGSRAVMSKWAPQKATDVLPSEAASPQGTSLRSSTDMEKPLMAYQSNASIDRGQAHSAAPELHKVDPGKLQAFDQSLRPNERSSATSTMTAGSLGCVLPSQDPKITAGVQGDQTKRLRRTSRRSSPVLSVKMGFDFPGHRAGK